MQCREIMEQDVQLVHPDDEVGSAADTMRCGGRLSPRV